MGTAIVSSVGAPSRAAGGWRKIAWDPDDETLTGSVVGQGALYETAAFFAGEPDGVLTFEDGECTCPVGYDCKHVAAIVIAATDARGARRSGPASALGGSRPPRRPPRGRRRCARSSKRPGARDGQAAARSSWRCTPSGLAGPGAPRLMARLMRPGARGGWVNGSLTWTALDSVAGPERRVPPRSRGAGPRAVRRPSRARGPARLLLQLRRRQDDSTSATATARSCGRCWTMRPGSGYRSSCAPEGLGEVQRRQQASWCIDVTRHGERGRS